MKFLAWPAESGWSPARALRSPCPAGRSAPAKNFGLGLPGAFVLHTASTKKKLQCVRAVVLTTSRFLGPTACSRVHSHSRFTGYVRATHHFQKSGTCQACWLSTSSHQHRSFLDPSVQILMSFLCGTMFALPLPPLFSFPALLDTASIARPAWSYISSFPASFATFVPKCCPSGPGHATDVKDSTGNADFSTPRFKAACARLRAAVCRIQLRELLVSPHAVDEIESFILSGPSPSKSPQEACSNSNVRCGTFGTVRNFEVIAGTTWTFFRGVSISKGTTLR